MSAYIYCYGCDDNSLDVDTLKCDCGWFPGKDDIERLERELAAARTEAEALRTALAMMYDKWVDGDDCYEEPDTFSGFLGKAFQLSITEEDHVISLLGKDCPTRAIDAAIAKEQSHASE